jgi:hypothetical protein
LVVGSKVSGGGLRCLPCYLLGNKIIMLLSGKYSIMWALNIRSSNDAC